MRKIFIILMMFTLITGCANEEEHTYEPKQEVTQTLVAVIHPEDVEEVESNTYRVTAYCACEKCCGKWALNRPVDENGNEIIRGASGERLIPGVSAASPLPFGTKIKLEGFGTVEVVDRTAQWIVDKHGENVVDIFFDNHQVALDFGVKHLEGVIVN